ncbi:hypothetical protein ES705_24271 [subsurface metagenome]
MEVEYKRRNNKEQCILSTENKKFLMKVEDREVKSNTNKELFVKFKINLIVRNKSLAYSFKANIFDYLKDGQYLTEKGFIYALYCFIGKAFWYSKFGLASTSEDNNLFEFLQNNNINDDWDLDFSRDRVYNECKTAFNFLIIDCNFTESFLAVIPAILEDYLFENYNDYYS